MKTVSAGEPTFSSEEIVAELVSRARTLMRKQYPTILYPTLDFSDAVWDLKPCDVSRGNKNCKPVFYRMSHNNRQRQGREALPDNFSACFKAWIILSNALPSLATQSSQCAKYLYASLENSGRLKHFSWSMLRNRDFEDAERLVLSRKLKSDNVLRRLRAFIVFGQENEFLNDSITWTPPRGEAGPDSSQKRRRDRLDRLPQRSALEALAEIYRTHAVELRDRLIICAIAILLCAGFRISELLTLPTDCLVSEMRRGRICWGIRYWKKKGRRNQYEGSIRWLSPLAAELVRECVSELLEITRPSREQAKVLERDTKSIRIPWGKQNWLTTDETARALANSRSTLISMLNRKLRQALPRFRKLGGVRYRRADVEAVLLSRRGPLFAFKGKHGQRQLLSDTLLIEFRRVANSLSPSEILVQHLPGSAIAQYVGRDDQRTDRPSAFTRFGYNAAWLKAKHPDDRYVMRTHMARHWLNTVAGKAGMTAFEITRWMRRDDPRHTRLYQHSQSEIAEYTREQLKAGRLIGEAADHYASLPLEQQETYINTIRAASKTAQGYCILSGLDCPNQKRCEVNCPDHLYDPNDRVARKELRRRRVSAKRALHNYKVAMREGRVVQLRQLQVAQEEVDAIEDILEKGAEKSAAIA